MSAVTTDDTSAPAQLRSRRWSYRVLVAWARSAIRVFYRRVEVDGIEHVPTDRPAMLAASHTNGLADVAVIVGAAPRFPHFLAASPWWKRRGPRTLFELGGVLPVHRPGDARNRQHSNSRTFAACHDALRAGEHLAIFPAGAMYDDPRGQPMKTGAARIALGAAADGVGEIAIVPVGLVYEDRGRFRSDAAIRFGEPIEIDDWLARYGAERRPTVRALTAQLTEAVDKVAAPLDARDLSAGSRRGRAARLAVLTPFAAAGAVLHAPVLLAGWIADRVCDEPWHATVKGVSGTALVPIVWAGEFAFLARRMPLRRATAITVGVAASGVAVLAWLDTRRELALTAGS
jgi:1-acyl-sn-glycerol-3-phosphate acyltransferase